MKRLVVILLITVFAGCTALRPGSGDLCPFLSKVLVEHGAALSSDAAVFAIEAQWEYRPDRYGFVLDVTGESFAKIDHFLRSHFGEPKIWDEANVDGPSHAVFSPEQTGGPAIQYLRIDTGSQVICIRIGARRSE
ncbi:MAG: hypothetical protein KAI66_26335 [Lentisphaeria bacterium]|nr:hypothetical protein [Lentisphaeria bacterium]